jgi:hypothetical protein
VLRSSQLRFQITFTFCESDSLYTMATKGAVFNTFAVYPRRTERRRI